MTESADSFRFRRDEVEAPRARREVQRYLVGRRLPAEIVQDLVLVVAEVVTNAVEHGTGSWFVVEIESEPSIVRIRVTQEGEADLGDPSSWIMPPPESTSGRGLAMVRGLVDDVRWFVADGQLTVQVDRRFEAD